MAVVLRMYDEPALRPDADARPLNALTIDVEDYFHAANLEPCLPRTCWDQLESRVAVGTRRLLDILAEANVQATFFVLGWVARRQRRLVREIQAAGHEIASHGYDHRLIYHQTPAQFRADVCQARNILEDITGQPVTAYRAPNFSIVAESLWALDILIEEGFTLDSSIYPVRHDRYGLPGTPLEPHRIERASGGIWEFPPPVWKVLGCAVPVGGGGYFRLYPYALTRRGLRAINAAGRPFAVYLHPWELDPDQPRFSPGWLRAFRHYVNLARTEKRLVQLVRDFSLGTISAALAHFAGPQDAPVPTLARVA
jgi:polysaccharide deacetylase family protein (PEP-CTERM system associated)